MDYLDFSTFKALGFSQLEETFNELLPKAARQLDGLTMGFYKRKHDFEGELKSEQDALRFRAEAFQIALGLTIEFMDETGITNTIELANENTPNVTIGRTHVDATNQAKALVSSAQGYVVPDEAVRQIAPYGLLYRGI
ncbi:hypothetical protein JK159_03905 [Weissella minor]|uniref:hypothetical protein n=1 Tax=Weissella minor TaxID=1620 RepID=UPI001BB0BBF8|nr:hypothetical protein [Weissella minor]MBS0949523.1 hypothetical protein [Weissella minor]